ncbi:MULTISPECIES: YihY/virulence factor BrkB family protein [unclassified Streptomyces]|uniref:YihY/virulence factor BrkB family protein n=1 Tax=unclassified Streptomyces TaxID=2593676 RepID=UPI002DDB174A|nr:YhjD/YihY/BrkB family envelope integrity protein [Streptomyces sp. NBC_00151]WRZ39860.1 YihY/virulence factor BrkB family protein [Streptomyces sp. NBC_00151]
MDWLKKIPGVGPWVVRLMATHAWRSYERLDRVKWTRLAAAMTFISFVALFPLLTVAAAIGAATLSTQQQKDLQDKLAEQVPGISDQLDINGLVQNAGTIGLVAGALLLVTGIGWVGSMRECLRAVWELPDSEENPLLRKLKDGGVLVGLGGAVLLTIVVSTLASTAMGWSARHLGIDENGWGSTLLQGVAFAVAVLADFLVLLYVLTLLPGVEPPRRRLIVAALIGAVGFELLKLLLSGYMRGVASKSMYGAFGVPIALLLWINFTSKLLLYSSAWTATPSERQDREAADDDAPAGPDGPAGSREPAGPRDRRDPEAPKNAKEAPEPRAVSGDGASGPAAASGG